MKTRKADSPSPEIERALQVLEETLERPIAEASLPQLSHAAYSIVKSLGTDAPPLDAMLAAVQYAGGSVEQVYAVQEGYVEASGSPA